MTSARHVTCDHRPGCSVQIQNQCASDRIADVSNGTCLVNAGPVPRSLTESLRAFMSPSHILAPAPVPVTVRPPPSGIVPPPWLPLPVGFQRPVVSSGPAYDGLFPQLASSLIELFSSTEYTDAVKTLTRMPRQRSFLWTGILIFASLTIMWYSMRQPCEIHPIRSSRTQILIVTSWRSGSTFVGQLFNQNPNAFYLVEPAWHVWARMPKEPYRLLHMPVRDLLRSVFSCDMSCFEPYAKRYRYITDLFLWHYSRALCSPPACNAFNRSDIIDRQMCYQKCGKISFESMGDTCKTYSHIVVKTVRVFDLHVLYPLLKDPLLNLKIIHLVRDPRGVFLSRERFQGLNRDDLTLTGEKNKIADRFQVMKEICEAQARIYNSFMQEPSSFMKGRYVLVRYEDLVKDPVGYVTDLYNYAGLSMSPQLQTWVYNITHTETPLSKRFEELTGNSEKIAQQWRQKLSLTKIMALQKICKQEMDLFGYQKVRSLREQRNMSLELVLPKDAKALI